MQEKDFTRALCKIEWKSSRTCVITDWWWYHANGNSWY